MVQLPAPELKSSKKPSVPTVSDVGMTAGLFATSLELIVMLPLYEPLASPEMFGDTAIVLGAVPEEVFRLIQDESALADHARLPLPALLTPMFWLGVVNPLAPKKVSDAGVVASTAVF